MLLLTPELEIPQHTLYHVSPKLFDFPCRKAIFEAREWSQWHPNGVLGLWTSTFPKMCSAFGQHVYRIDLADSARRIGIDFESFYDVASKMDDESDWMPLINWLCVQGDVAYLIDANDHVGEVIILNFKQIKSFQNVTGQPLTDMRIPIGMKEVG